MKAVRSRHFDCCLLRQEDGDSEVVWSLVLRWNEQVLIQGGCWRDEVEVNRASSFLPFVDGSCDVPVLVLLLVFLKDDCYLCIISVKRIVSLLSFNEWGIFIIMLISLNMESLTHQYQPHKVANTTTHTRNKNGTHPCHFIQFPQKQRFLLHHCLSSSL